MDTVSKLDLLDQNHLFHTLVWDYQITPSEFASWLENPSNERNHLWAVTRTISRADYYSAIRLVGKDHLRQIWPQIKPRLRNPDQITAYDYLLSR